VRPSRRCRCPLGVRIPALVSSDRKSQDNVSCSACVMASRQERSSRDVHCSSDERLCTLFPKSVARVERLPKQLGPHSPTNCGGNMVSWHHPFVCCSVRTCGCRHLGRTNRTERAHLPHTNARENWSLSNEVPMATLQTRTTLALQAKARTLPVVSKHEQLGDGLSATRQPRCTWAHSMMSAIQEVSPC
jgi:hypothetical protein